MAPRKDMMRVIRRDAGFSATLGFGEGAGDPKDDRSPTSNARETLTPALAIKGEAGRGAGSILEASATIEDQMAATGCDVITEAETSEQAPSEEFQVGAGIRLHRWHHRNAARNTKNIAITP